MEMATRALATATTPMASSPRPHSPSSKLASIAKSNTKPQLKSIKPSLPSSTALSLFTLFINPPLEAKALSFPKEQVVSSLTQVEQTIDQVQEVGSGFLDAAQQVYQVIAEALKPGIDVALPILQQAGEQAMKAASPAMSEVSKKAQEAIQSSGIDTEPVLNAAKTVTSAAEQTTQVFEEAKPLASSAVETISNSDPVVIVETAAALFVAYILLPPIWSAITFNLRGYKGAFTPAQTLDLMCTRNHFLIDIRSESDKNKSGIPRLPPSAKNQMIAIPLEELPSKLRGVVKNVKKVEAEIAALKISYLKRLSKGSSIVIMDSYSDSAKVVARTLTSLGFKNCWIMADGFSGGKGWSRSQLGTESYNLSFAEVLSPSRIISQGTGRFSAPSRKFLPGSS